MQRIYSYFNICAIICINNPLRDVYSLIQRIIYQYITWPYYIWLTGINIALFVSAWVLTYDKAVIDRN